MTLTYYMSLSICYWVWYHLKIITNVRYVLTKIEVAWSTFNWCSEQTKTIIGWHQSTLPVCDFFYWI